MPTATRTVLQPHDALITLFSRHQLGNHGVVLGINVRFIRIISVDRSAILVIIAVVVLGVFGA